MRGVDQEGQVANYVETEQIIEFEGHKCSFVQVISFIGCNSLFDAKSFSFRREAPFLYSGHNYRILNINLNQRR